MASSGEGAPASGSGAFAPPPGPNRIISASRRTDLPGFHADACAGRLLRLRRPVHSVVFWTRHPRGLLEGSLGELLRAGIENPLVQLTVTGLGGSRLEPAVPPTAAVLATLEPLIHALRGQPRRILWRFDPVIREAMSPVSFAALAAAFGGLGVRICTISFPAQLSLKGPLEEQYRRAGITRPDRRTRRELTLRLAEVAARHGIALEVCAQPQLVTDTGGAVAAACCISAARCQELHPRGLPLTLDKDPAQRRHCQCVRSDDIGRYGDRCGSGCAYCYSAAGGPTAAARQC